MIQPKVIDASVATKWFLEIEAGREQALAVLDHLKMNPDLYIVPDLFYSEMVHVLCRIFADLEKVQACTETLIELGIERFPLDQKALAYAAELVKKFRLSGYDAIYAANAKLVGGLWITADENAHRKIEKLKISQLLGD